MLEAERQLLFRHAWQFVGLERELRAAGDFLTLDGPAERALVLRDAAGTLQGFRNSCRQRPHALAMDRHGRFAGAVACPLHGLRYGFDGEPLDGTPGGPLTRLELAVVSGFVFARAAGAEPAAPPAPMAAVAATSLPLQPSAVREHEVAADWKVLVEQWLERPTTGTEFEDPGAGAGGWSAGRYRTLAAHGGGAQHRSSFVAPNQLIDAGAGGVLVLQVVPVAPGRARLRAFHYAREARTREERALGFLAARLAARRTAAEARLAESVQRGLESPGYLAEAVAAAPPALVAFRQSIARLLPGGARDPGDPA